MVGTRYGLVKTMVYGLVCLMSVCPSMLRAWPPSDAQYTRSVLNEGDLTRLHRAFDKGRSGQPLVIGAIGGSITQAGGYLNLVAAWWDSAFPQSSITIKNAGIGATNSLFGAHRVAGDLLSAQPDFMIVEYAVNDPDDSRYKETVEGIVRQGLKSQKQPAVMLLFMFNQSGTSRQNLHAPVGYHYQLPMISYYNAFWPDVQGNPSFWNLIADDGVHPNNNGHDLCAGLIKRFLSERLRAYTGPAAAVPATPAPLVSNVFEYTSRVKKDWSSWAPNEMTEQFSGTCVSLLYKVSNGTQGLAQCWADDRSPVTLNGWFSGTWGEYKACDVVTYGLAPGNHTLHVKLQGSSYGGNFLVFEMLVAGSAADPAFTATPAITPNSGNFNDSVQVSLTCATDGAAIRYTTDGNIPSGTSALYAGPFWLKSTATVKAMGIKTGLTNSNEASATFTKTVSGQSPYSGTAVAIPDTIEAENFDNGGEGVAYHDLTGNNQGGQYRTAEGVDVENIPGGGYMLGYVSAGEWTEYTVSAAAAGYYDIGVRVANGGAGGQMHIEFGGVNKTGAISVPNTGSYSTFQTVNVPHVELSAGTQVMRVAFDVAGAGGGVANLDYINIKPSSTVINLFSSGNSNSKMIMVSPNPMRDRVTFVLPKNFGINAQVEIYGRDGRVVRIVGATGRSPIQWDGTDLTGRPIDPGVYFYTVTMGDRQETGRIMVLPQSMVGPGK